MSSVHEQHDAHHYGTRALPASLGSPEILTKWRTQALIVFAVASLVSLVFLFVKGGAGHMLRAYLLGFMTLLQRRAGGGLAMLMVQYVSGGKWGMILRRPLEAMSRTLPLVALMIIPILLLIARHLYQWARFPNASGDRWRLLRAGR